MDTNIVNLQTVCHNNDTTFLTLMNSHVCFHHGCFSEEICMFFLVFFTYEASQKYMEIT